MNVLHIPSTDATQEAISDPRAAAEHLRVLQLVIQVANRSTDIGDALQRSLELLCSAVRASAAQVYLRSTPGSFAASVWHGDDQRYAQLRAALRADLPLGQGAAGRAAASGDIILIEDLRAGGAASYIEEAARLGVVSVWAVPLTVGETVVGVIELFLTQPQEADHSLLSHIGLLLGSTVERLHVGAQLRANQAQLHAILDNCPGSIYVKDTAGLYLLVNRVFEEWFGWNRADVLGKTDYNLVTNEIADQWRANDQRVLASETPVKDEETALFGGEQRTFFSIKFPLWDSEGTAYATCGITTDITDRKRAEEERTQLQEEIIRVQAATLAELSTPLIPITENIVVMPLIGTMDSQRAQQMLSTLLSGVSQQRASCVILDITGIPIVDTAVANILVNATQSLRLLGAETIITGIRPEVAQTLVGLGLDLSGMTTAGSLRNGIALALNQDGQQLQLQRSPLTRRFS
jgi:PAS domain S-box-containing protein